MDRRACLLRPIPFLNQPHSQSSALASPRSGSCSASARRAKRGPSCPDAGPKGSRRECSIDRPQGLNTTTPQLPTKGREPTISAMGYEPIRGNRRTARRRITPAVLASTIRPFNRRRKSADERSIIEDRLPGRFAGLFFWPESRSNGHVRLGPPISRAKAWSGPRPDTTSGPFDELFQPPHRIPWLGRFLLCGTRLTGLGGEVSSRRARGASHQNF